MARPDAGGEPHKQLFCQTFIETHDPYKASDIVFPEIDPASRARLAGLPIWDEAVNTERETAGKVQRMAGVETDPLLRQAIALQGFEESRHAALLDRLTQHYEIPVQRRSIDLGSVDPTWDFTRTEYGECFDAFFAFGLFAIGRHSGFVPEPLIKLFDPIMQEEARHILFFVNWVAHRRAHTPAWRRPWLDAERGLAVSFQALSRMRTALALGGAEQDNFTMTSHGSLGDFSLRGFLELCVRENERRLSRYDERLLRPRFAPAVARALLRVLPQRGDA